MSIAADRPYQTVPQTIVGPIASTLPVTIAPGAVMPLATIVTVPNDELWFVIVMGSQYDLDVEADFVSSNTFFAIVSPGLKPVRMRADNERQVLGVNGRAVITSPTNKFEVGPGRIIATNVSLQNVGAVDRNVTGAELVVEAIRYRVSAGRR